MTVAIRKPEPVNYLQRDIRALSDTNADTGERWYPHPLTDERFLSVTTALHIVGKYALIPWSGNLAAAAAMEKLPKLIKAARRKPCGLTNTEQACGDCRTCVETWVARRHHFESEEGKRRGSKIHDVVEGWAYSEDGTIPDHDDQIHPWVMAFQQFVDTYQPEPFIAETTVISRANGGWAGTLDLGATIRADAGKEAADLCARYGLDAVRLLIDTKTTKHQANNFFVDWALQLGGGYCHAEAVMFRDGREFPMPEFDGAAVLLLRPDKPCLRPIVCDDAIHGAFLAAVSLFRWMDTYGPASTQVKSFPLPTPPEPAVKPRKTAVKPANGTRKPSVRRAADPFTEIRAAQTPGEQITDDQIPF